MHEDLSSDALNPGILVHTCNPSTEGDREKWTPGAHRTADAAGMVNSRFSNRLCLDDDDDVDVET